MSLQVFFQDDIRRVLRALALAGEAQGPVYQRALIDVGVAFGVGPADDRLMRLVEEISIHCLYQSRPRFPGVSVVEGD